jgi:hypothetical protein
MRGQKDFLARLVKAFEKAGVDYMVAGSIGSSFHGQPRATNDIDIVVEANRDQLRAFVETLGEGYYVSQSAVEAAVKNNSAFNVIDTQACWKADIIVRKDRPFSLEEFRRRERMRLLGMDVAVVSAEDVILSKLEWSKSSGSEVQFKDALGVAVVQWDKLDKAYLCRWAEELGVGDALKLLLDEVEELK